MSTTRNRRSQPTTRVQAGSKKTPAAVETKVTLRSEIESRQRDQRLTPANRRIVQVLLDHEPQVGFLSSMELAELANVSQPSVTRFATALGFEGFAEMRKRFREVSNPTSAPSAAANKYQSAAGAEATNVSALSDELADIEKLRTIGAALASSKPLVVLGLRASSGLATHFGYFASKVHPDVRTIVHGGSMVEDTIEQAHVAGAKVMLVFALPLYPRETIDALRHAQQLGLQVIAVSDPGFNDPAVSHKLTARFHSSLVYDSSAASMVLISVLIDAMCDAMSEYAERRLVRNEQSSTKRRVFVR